MIVSPTALSGTGIVRTTAGRSEPSERSTSTCPPTATKAHFPSGVTAAPKGLPAIGTIAVRTRDSAACLTVGPLHPGDASERVGRAGALDPAPEAAPVAEAVPTAEAAPVAEGGRPSPPPILRIPPAPRATS